MKSKIEKAKLLGTIAHAEGKPCTPVLNNELMKMLSNDVGDKMNTKLMKAFIKGWTSANLKI